MIEELIRWPLKASISLVVKPDQRTHLAEVEEFFRVHLSHFSRGQLFYYRSNSPCSRLVGIRPTSEGHEQMRNLALGAISYRKMAGLGQSATLHWL